MIAPAIDAAAHGRATIAKGSKSFALASRLLPAAVRDDAVQLYAWCRYADDVIDGQELGHGPICARGGDEQARLVQLSEATERALAGRPDPHPAFIGLASVVTRHQIPPHHPRELLRGFAMDVEGRTYLSFDDTLDYCYHVAGVVGVMMARIMDVRDETTLDRAADLGIAFQLTNIARDVAEDAAAGRIYLPRTWLDAAGVAPNSHDLLTAPNQQPLYSVILRLLAEADRYYQSAECGITALPPGCAYGTRLAAQVYRAIGVERRRLGPAGLHRRPVISGWFKFLSLATALPLARRFDPPRPKDLYRRPLRE